MTTRLNGWRRIGFVLVIGWSLIVVGIAGYEFNTPGRGSGLFVFLDLPKGMIVYDDGTASLPDGRKLTLQNRGPGNGKPWDIDWSREPDVREKTLTVRWSRFLIVLLMLPAITWMLGEAAVWLAGWIKQGFRREEQ